MSDQQSQKKRPSVRSDRKKFDPDVLARIQSADGKIKRATLRGVYKDALLKKLRTDHNLKRLPKTDSGIPLHKMDRWALIEHAVVNGINGKRYNHQDFWSIRRDTKHVRSKKEETSTGSHPVTVSV